jgi:hypothetical protein
VRRGLPTLAWLTVAALVAAIWVAYVRPLGHFDVDVFLRAGAAVAAGQDPYPAPGTPQVYSGYAFVYPYLTAFPFVPLAWLPRAVGEAVFIALSVLAVLAGCRLAGARGWRPTALVLAASSTIIGLQMGTLNALLFLGLAALWRLRDRPLPAGLIAALLVYSKLFLLPLPLWLLLTRRTRAAAVSVGALAVLFGGGQLVSPVDLRTYAGMLDALARVEAPGGMSLTGLLMNAGVTLGTATWVARCAASLLVAGCWMFTHRDGASPARTVLARALRRSPGRSATLPGPDPATCDATAAVAGTDAAATAGPRAGFDVARADRLLFAATVAAALLASPIVWAHYLLLLAAPLLVLEGGERTGALGVATVGSWLMVTPHLSTMPEVAVSVVVVTLLAAAPLRHAARRLTGRGPVAIARAGALALPAVGIVTLGAAGLEVCWALTRAHHRTGAVTGEYLATLGVLALLTWGAYRAGSRG